MTQKKQRPLPLRYIRPREEDVPAQALPSARSIKVIRKGQAIVTIPTTTIEPIRDTVTRVSNQKATTKEDAMAILFGGTK